MHARLRPAAALMAALTLSCTPALAGADRRDHGLHVQVRDAGFWLGLLRHHSHVDSRMAHYREYLRVERELAERRGRLLQRTRYALEQEDFDKTAKLLARLVEADHDLAEHRGEHRSCRH